MLDLTTHNSASHRKWAEEEYALFRAIEPTRYEEEEILEPFELIAQYKQKRAALNAEIDSILEKIETALQAPK